ncbi:MAG: hypothetical protein VYE68_13355 [Acidobacteriota bacterium]|nr:hypothetical protein [Acidobacteriota bacterium]
MMCSCPRLTPVVVLILVTAAVPVVAQTRSQLLVTAVGSDPGPVDHLTPADFVLSVGGVELEVGDVEPLSDAVQIVAVFEDLAVTQRQLNDALAQFIDHLDDETLLDMLSVDGTVDAAIIEAIDDLNTRRVPRPVIVMLGQASEIAPSELPSSQVRGRRRAADLTGNVDQLAELVTDQGILFYGVSITDVALPSFERLARAGGGRFIRLEDPSTLSEALAAVAFELESQYIVSYMAPPSTPLPDLEPARPGLRLRVAPFVPNP